MMLRTLGLCTALCSSLLLPSGDARAEVAIYDVYFLDKSGTARAFPRKVSTSTPLTKLVEAFFSGPTPAERAKGALAFGYACAIEDAGSFREKLPCSFGDIVRVVAVEDGGVRIEVNAYPHAAAGGIWKTLNLPLGAIVRQFPHVKSWTFAMGGRRISGGDFGGPPCAGKVCFVFCTGYRDCTDAGADDPNAGVPVQPGGATMPTLASPRSGTRSDGLAPAPVRQTPQGFQLPQFSSATPVGSSAVLTENAWKGIDTGAPMQEKTAQSSLGGHYGAAPTGSPGLIELGRQNMLALPQAGGPIGLDQLVQGPPKPVQAPAD